MNTAILTIRTLDGETVVLRPATWIDAYNQIAQYISECPKLRLLGFGIN